MGYRDRIRRQASGFVKSVVRRTLGEGGQSAGPVLSERTSVWPPHTMGVGPVEHEPGLHPVDAASQGIDLSFHADDWPADQAERPTPATSADVDPFGGSVSQGEYFPEPVVAEPVVAEPVVAEPVVAEPVVAEQTVEQVSAAAIEPASGEPLELDQQQDLEAQVVEQMKTIFDPEIPIDIYELGLIYDVIVSANRDVQVNMTLTSPNCPAAQELPAEVELKAIGVDGIRHAFVDIVWDPPWGPHLMSEAAKLELNIW